MTTNCIICNKEIHTNVHAIKNGEHKYCSKKCHGLAKIKNILVKCCVCDKEIKKTPSEMKASKNHYCSRTCYNLGMKKGILTKCLICNKEFGIVNSILKNGHGKYCSQRCYGLAVRGENGNNWLGGKSEIYQSHRTERAWEKIRKQVYKRDNWTCQICGKTNTMIHAHHIVPYRISQDDSLDNLISLCQSCHRKEEIKYYRKLNEMI